MIDCVKITLEIWLWEGNLLNISLKSIYIIVFSQIHFKPGRLDTWCCRNTRRRNMFFFFEEISRCAFFRFAKKQFLRSYAYFNVAPCHFKKRNIFLKTSIAFDPIEVFIVLFSFLIQFIVFFWNPPENLRNV